VGQTSGRQREQRLGVGHDLQEGHLLIQKAHSWSSVLYHLWITPSQIHPQSYVQLLKIYD